MELAELRERLGDFGTAPYLVTTGPDLVPHTTHVVVAFDGDTLRCAVGRKTAANVDGHPGVCLLWPPYQTGGYSLIVDGAAVVGEDGGRGRVVTVTPTGAVLHRNARADDGGYAADCLDIGGAPDGG